MKKTTSSLLPATVALGLIATSIGVAFASETPTLDQPASPAPVPSIVLSADPVPGNGTDNNDAPQPNPQPSDMSQPSSTPDLEPSQGSQSDQSEPSTPAVDQTPATDQGGAGAASGPVGTTGVTTRGRISTGNGSTLVPVRGGICNMSAPVNTPAASNLTLANTGSVTSVAAGAGIIVLAGGVTLMVARKHHRGIFA